ncbi:anti-repressor SinI family protein [Fictibacillus barbaricus]|uniref:Anti-repressor SinI family protein n=1 Tax=Fictibacillus barbaricus TaxID=182136 RepID=A0ABS2ZFR7_9BACL|nr:anti-repressor SinI family protein [Fictibacillus barbaricus]MBN3546492.1 anti-repressor SinI family protein [Fictibacillus barbaricus]
MSLDQEWIELILEARDQGFTKEEIIDFLNNPTPFFTK